MAGSLPQQMIHNFDRLRAAAPSGPKMYAYHGHREMLYALSFFYNVSYNLPGPGTPLIPEFSNGAIPPTTTLLFELHENGGEHFVRLLVWRPCHENDNPAQWPADQGHTCEAIPLRMGSCDEYCPYSKWTSFLSERVAKTGTWDTICARGAKDTYDTPTSYDPAAGGQAASSFAAATGAAATVASVSAETSSSFFGVFSTFLVGSLVVCGGAALLYTVKNRHEYDPIGSQSLL
jgi:hypothetical protein